MVREWPVVSGLSGKAWFKKKGEQDTWPNQWGREEILHEEGAAISRRFMCYCAGARTEIAGGYSRVSVHHMAGPGFTLSLTRKTVLDHVEEFI